MRAFLMPNTQKIQAYNCATQLATILLTQGGKVLVDDRQKDQVAVNGITYAPASYCLQSCDVIIAIGGDGTIIHSARHAVEENKPVLGINAGHMGFLAQAEPDNLELLCKRLLNGDFQIEDRFVLLASVKGGNDHYTAYAINDAVLSKGQGFNLVDLEFYCDGKYMDSFRADGVIFATPTGSTAYSMSAGGPIVDSALDAILMTPICPHRLSARALLFSAEKTMMVRLQSTQPLAELYLSVDGAVPRLLAPGEYLEIRKAESAAQFITFGEKEFFEILTEKIVQRGL